METRTLIRISCLVVLVYFSITSLKAQHLLECFRMTDTLTISMNTNASMMLETFMYSDTLDARCDTFGFIYPIVLSQCVYFIIDDSIVAKRKLDFLPFHTHQFKFREIQIQTLPIFDIGIYKGSDGYYYFLYGASFCNGMNCPEYLGIYNSQGKLLFECISSNNYQYSSKFRNLEDFCYQKGININDPFLTRSFYNIFRHEQ